MIHLKTLNKKKLEEFVSSGEFKNYDFLPITEHRAKSHIKNTKAEENQALLILAFDDEKLAGYIGCFPDNFKVDGQQFNYAWLSTLFISDQLRGKKIAQTLLNKVFEEYGGNIAITEFTKEAESLYHKIGAFNYIEPKIGKRYYFRTDLKTIIPLKREKTRFLKPIFKATDFLFNSLISLKNFFTKKPDFRFEILDKIDSESSLFIAEFKSNRTVEEINWAIENPWVLEGNNKDEKYVFSSFSKSFKYFWIKIYDENGALKTCALLFIREGHLKIPYLFAASNLDKCVDFLRYFITKHKVKTMTTYQTALNKKIDSDKTFPKIHQRNLERRYLFHKELLNNLPKDFQPNFQDGDGDCLMT